ncbi:MAG: membrane integrity-associated transporter subunit PqiC [Candidatus Tectomicrobia bacterium]|nr:membrane integrity-associated transporter subunit PqiC [Candidatus Tectomicrobia bacterium]
MKGIKRIAQIALMTLLAVLLGACSLPATGRPANIYLLSPSPSLRDKPAVSEKTGRATLLINLPRAQAGFDTPRMVYLLRPHEVNYYAKNQWADTPSRMLAPLLVEAMEMTGCWHAVVQMPAAVQGDYRLDTEIVQLQHEFFSSPSRMRLTLRVQLVELAGQSVIAAQLFEIVEDAPGEDAYGGVTAANRALGKLLSQVAEWVNDQIGSRGPGAGGGC